LKKVFQFRYKIILGVYPKSLNSSNIKNCEESDEYDPYSIHFVALDEDGDISATVRLIHHSPIGYPTENSSTFDKSMFERYKLAEMSRIFIATKYRSMQSTKNIINGLKKLMFVKMMQLGVEYSYGSLEENFLRLLKIYKLCYHTLANKSSHGSIGSRYPCILYTKQFGTDNPELIKLWEKECETEIF
jgi:N-acyl-L-homoserine lactone synthetase